MLYKEHWQELSYSGISLRSLIAWLETMPADEPYSFIEPTNCLAAQYLRANGKSRGASYVYFNGERTPPEGKWLESIVTGEPRTFGAALERAQLFITSLHPAERN